MLGDLRLVKDAGELDTMRRPARISAGAHARAMRWCGGREDDAVVTATGCELISRGVPVAADDIEVSMHR